MKKYLLALGATSALLLLGGAGCDKLNQLYQSTAGSNSSPVETATSTAITPPSGNIVIKAEALNPGIVKFNWQVPADFNNNHTFFLLHSAKPEPVYPGAFFYRRSGVDREGAWGNIPAGTRYFRICEADGEKCLNYSNTVQLDVQ